MSDTLKELEEDLKRERAALVELAYKAGQQCSVINGMIGQADAAIEKSTNAQYDGVGRTLKLIVPLMRARRKYLYAELSQWIVIVEYIDSRDKEIVAILGIEEEVNANGLDGSENRDNVSVDAGEGMASVGDEGGEAGGSSGVDNKVSEDDELESFGGTDTYPETKNTD